VERHLIIGCFELVPIILSRILFFVELFVFHRSSTDN
jgi:hypothetical protein